MLTVYHFSRNTLAPADVAAAEAGGEVDRVDRAIGGGLRRATVGAGRGDREHAAARCDELAVAQLGAGLEDLRAGRLGGIDPAIAPPVSGVPG